MAEEKKPKRITKKMQLDEAAIQRPGPENYRCQQCPRPCQPVRPPVNATGRIMVVYGTPEMLGQREDGFANGDGGRLLKHHVLKPLKLRPEDIVFTGVVRCGDGPVVKKEKPVKAVSIDMCSAFLRQEIVKLTPRLIVACGSDAARSLGFKFQENVGTVQWYEVAVEEKVPVAITYSPEHGLTDGCFGVYEVMCRHIRRALSPEPWREFPEMEVV